MIPPVDQAVLKNNPAFSALFATLSTVLLDTNGATKNDGKAKERGSVREPLKASIQQLYQHRLGAAKRHLLLQALATTSAEGDTTDARTKNEDLVQLLVLLPPLLRRPSPTEDEAVLLSSPPLCELPSLLPALARLISTRLQKSAVGLARIAKPTTNPSFVHRSIPEIPGQVMGLQDGLATCKCSLTDARLAAAAALTDLLSRNAAALSVLIRALEAKHGPVSRSLELRAGHVSLQADIQRFEADALLSVTRRDMYTPEAEAALANYARHLREANIRLEAAIRRQIAQLAEYGVGVPDTSGSRLEQKTSKEKTMREMARVYREMQTQLDDVRSDLSRLGRA